MSEFYLNNLIEEESSTHETIIKILQARGFLIDLVDGRYYLSDNAHPDDAEYLAKGLKDFGLGEIKNCSNREATCRKSLRTYTCFSTYSKKRILPHTLEIVLKEDASVKSATDLFQGIEIKGGEAGPCIITWSQYKQGLYGRKVELAFLEPYIAFYVKAVSACGVWTASSCDGNHDHGKRIYIEADRPSDIWHECLWRYLVQPRFESIAYIGKGIRVNDDNRAKIYQTVNEIAQFLYNKRIEIRGLKRRSVENITKQYCKHATYREISEFYRSECCRVLQGEPVRTHN